MCCSRIRFPRHKPWTAFISADDVAWASDVHKVTVAAFFVQEATVRIFFFKVALQIFCNIITIGIQVNASCNVSNLFCRPKNAKWHLARARFQLGKHLVKCHLQLPIDFKFVDATECRSSCQCANSISCRRRTVINGASFCINDSLQSGSDDLIAVRNDLLFRRIATLEGPDQQLLVQCGVA